MSLGVNNILDCLELNTPVHKRDIEEFLPPRENSSSTSLSHLLIDVDTSLERLYGGFYPDWLAGGEWSHLYSYLLSLLKTCQELSICLVFCFDGTLYRYGQSQWYYEQIQQRKKVNQIFKHLKQNKTGLPRRHLWFPPPAFQLSLRTILRELNSPYLVIYQTWGYGSCQHQEQMKICAEQYQQSLIGIISSDLEFFFPNNVKDPKISLRNFSSKHFKLSLKGKLTLVQIKFHQFQDQFSLDNQQFALLLTLLGNHILSDSDLVHFHNDLLHEHESNTSASKRNISKSNGTTSPSNVADTEMKSEHDSPDHHTPETNDDHPQTSSVTSPVQFSSQSRPNQTINITVDQLIPRLVDYVKKQHLDKEIDFHSIANQIFKHVNDEESSRIKTHLLIDSYNYYYKAINENQSDSIETSTTSCSSNQVSMNKSDKNDPKFDPNSGISSEVLHTAFNLHKQGLMMPWIFQCLYKHEITFPVTIEPEMCNTIPSICEFYRPIRKYLYSLLFDTPTKIREQVYNSEHGSYLTEVLVEPLPSKPTIEQLWFGTSPDEDRQLRLKAFLQSLYYCDLPRIHSIPHDYLLFICLLRYIYMEFFRYSSTSAILHTYELMAFISQAVLINELQPKPLMNSQSTSFSNQYDHIQIANYETRPIQLAHLFMRGLETMIFANEICGAPIHPKYCCPAHFFNGKLFHQKYLQAQYHQQNQDLIFILSDQNTHCAQIISNLLDVVLDRSSNNQIHHTPMQLQHQYAAVPQQQQQQRIMKYPSQQARTPTLMANSTRPLMRTNNKQGVQHHQQTPIANYRQQPQQPPPPMKQAGPMRNGELKKNNHATPFNAKAQQQIKKFNTHTPTTMNFSTPQQQHALPTSQWVDPNRTAILTQHQPSPAINNMQSMPIQHPTPLTNTYLNPLDEQMLHLHIQPPPAMATPMAYSHPPAILNPHISLTPYNHLHPHPIPYTLANGAAAFYQPSPQSTTSYPQHFTTPYHPHHPALLPGLPPHAPLAAQRTVHYPTNNTNTYPQPPQRLSPTSIQTQEMNIQALQQRILDQQTPISLQRQLNRLPLTVDYSQFDIHRSNSHNGIPIPMQSCPHPSMLTEHQQRLHGH